MPAHPSPTQASGSSPAQALAPRGPGEDPHRSLHSEQGALRGEHPGRSRNPVVKVADLAWLEFEKPDLDEAEGFARDFGFAIVARTPRHCGCGACGGGAGMVIRRGVATLHRAGVPR